MHLSFILKETSGHAPDHWTSENVTEVVGP